MIKKLHHQAKSKILKSEFIRNVVTLITGTTVANVLPIAAAPILTRIFTPKDFGLFAFYFSTVTILAVFTTARYELAITLPKKKNYAYQIVILSWVISTVVSLLILLFVWLFEKKIAELINNSAITNLLYLIPLSTFLTGIYQSLYYWFNREKDFKRMSFSSIFKNSTILFFQICFGFLSKLSVLGLILGQLIGQILGTLYMGQKFIKSTRHIFKPNRLKQFALAKRYINFPKFLLLAHTMNATTRQLPVILFNTLFNSTIAGFYFVVQRVIGFPVTIISIAIGDVFKQQASEAYAERGECLDEYKNTFKKLLVISLLSFGIFIFIAPDLFAIIFGESWRVAGEYSQILTPMFLLRFISNPLSNMFVIAEKQKIELFLQIGLLFAVGSSFLIGYIFEDDILAIFLLSTANTLIYSINTLLTWKFAKGL